MPNDFTKLISQIDRALTMYGNMRAQTGYDDLSGPRYSSSERHEILNILIGTIERVTPKPSSYWSQYQTIKKFRSGGVELQDLAEVVGILRALQRDLSEDLVGEFEELIHAEVFGNFLEMAEYLLESGYKDPAAVMVGGVLEEHLRKLAIKNSIPVIGASGSPKKADTLNTEMMVAGIFSKLEQKNIIAWLDLRNKAAHGHYGEYIKEQVEAMLQGVRSFISRFQA